MSTRSTCAVVVLLAVFSSCAKPKPPITMETIAERYVKLVLALGVHDPAYVDMFYGPEAWQRDASGARQSLTDIQNAGTHLLDELSQPNDPGAPAADAPRRTFLLAQVRSLIQRATLLSGARIPFDEESHALFGMTAPQVAESTLEPLVEDLGHRLPGHGPVAGRLEKFSRSLAVQADRVPAVVSASLAACRARTAAHLSLPGGEAIEIRYVHGRPWSAYARYQGQFKTRIEVNLDLPRRPDQILDLMCHEGYPGHHTQYSLQELQLVRERGWGEFQVLPLLSPASALSEGAATAGVDLAFAADDRRTFEHDTLFPLAGLEPSHVETVEAVRRLTMQLEAAGTEGARRYLDGQMTRADTVMWLERYGAMPRPLELLGFVDRFRSYVVGYTAGASRVRQYMEREDTDDRWSAFERAISGPNTPATLE